MKRKISTLFVLVSVCSLSMAFNVCADDSVAEQEQTVEADFNNEKPKRNSETMAKVVSVNENTINVKEAEKMGRGRQRPVDMENVSESERPEPPEGERPEKPEGEIPEPPEGEIPEKPEGERPEMTEGEKPELNFNGEEKTIVVDEAVIYKEGENGEKIQASISDLAVDTVISITYDDDGITPIEILIKE